MPVAYLSRLISPERSARANLQLGICLAFVAGAVNAGGFLAIGQYTSHMTGIVSSAADNLVLGNIALAAAGFLSLGSFVSGAATTALLVNYAKRNGKTNIYTTPLIIEALLLLVFGFVGARLQLHELVSVSLTTVLLCYVMGLQNALVTKISNAEIRTTHLTGLVTDFGIELGKLLYWNRSGSGTQQLVLANRKRLVVHSSLIVSFFTGGLTGALGFKYVGFSSTVPLAVVLVLISMAPSLKPSKPTL
ncbi:YoaK family protein [Noviherbaspirillum massiliense]|uniref:YoaK family protein n=1 Tax=Noviherbaspirillum massiliense TaxID=1465823 RepID=UPI0002E855BD|nr:YoaK family protein [Noviherbaspirillum massiliense]